MTSDWLHEIARWKLEAADEDTHRYFFQVRGITSLQSGENHYVIGRKGSGKTAVVEHIKSMQSSEVYVHTMSFKDFPFNELYRLSDSNYTRPSQYTTVWKFIIYSALCVLMTKNPRIDALVSKELSDHLNLNIERALAKSLLKWTDVGGGFTFLGTGANATTKSSIVANDASLSSRTDALEKTVKQHIDASYYYILFDELDEDFKNVLDVDVSSSYFDLLTGLFKAVQSVKRIFSKDAKINPIVFLREDIFDIMRDNDKNKWRDSAVTLNWTQGELQKLLAFRLTRASNPFQATLADDDVFKMLFQSVETRAGGRKEKRHVFQYIASRTLMRPRDFISYLRECAKLAIDGGSNNISLEQMVDANRGYSIRLREEFVDEIQASIPYINDVLDLFSQMRKQIFSFKELNSEYIFMTSEMPKARVMDFSSVCRILFHYSVIGNQTSQRSNHVFRYIYPEAKLNFTENGIIHPGLLRSFQIK